jgi:PA14 domain
VKPAESAFFQGKMYKVVNVFTAVIVSRVLLCRFHKASHPARVVRVAYNDPPVCSFFPISLTSSHVWNYLMRPLTRYFLVPLLAAVCTPFTAPFVIAAEGEAAQNTAPAAQDKDAGLVSGILAEYYEKVDGKYPSQLTGQKPVLVRKERTMTFPQMTGQFHKTKLSENFSARYSGFIRVPAEETYTFALESDDGSTLSINGKLLIDNGGVHPMQDKRADITLTAGDHAFVVEYFQGTGEAGLRLMWGLKSSKKVKNVSKESFFFKKGADEAIAWDKEAWDKRKGGGGTGRYALMDHGPTYTGSFILPKATISKGISIRLNKELGIYGIFDPELLSFTYGGFGLSLAHPAGRNGLEGQPEMEGDPAFAVQGAGWAKPGSMEFADPRIDLTVKEPPAPKGNLPATWGTYRGHYLDGQNVIFSYVVGSASVLETTDLEAVGAKQAISRTLTLSDNSAPLTLQLATTTKAKIDNGIAIIAQDDGITAIGVVAGGTIALADERVTLTLAAQTTGAKILTWKGPAAELATFRSALTASAKPRDLSPVKTKGGKPRWSQTVATKGTLGKAQEAYVVDTLTVPYDNPYLSYMRTSALDFFSDGRIAVSTIDGDVWIVSGVDDKLENLTWKRYASGMFQTLGLKIVDDVVYVTNRDRLTRLHDLNKDGEADFYENFNGDCEVTPHYHEFALGLERDKEGNFYYNKGSNLVPDKWSSEHQGCMLKISPDGKTMTRYAFGLRAPNGLGGGDGWPLTNSDNQGNWTPASRINLVKEGGFYGFKGTAHRLPLPDTFDQPICWLPQSVDNSSGGQVWVSSDKWGPLKGNLIHMSYGKSAMFVMPFEEVDGVAQGGAVKLPLNFVSSAMRARFSPIDGQLYMTGLYGWQTNGVGDGCLHRVRYTGLPVLVPNKLSVSSAGVTMTFPVELDADIAGDKDNYAVEQWNYRYTSAYGSADYKPSNPDQQGRDKVEVKGVVLSADNKSVTIQLDKVIPVMQQCIKFKIATAEGTMITNELHHTIHKVK